MATQTDTTSARPDWFNEIFHRFKSGEAHILGLTGDGVFDYVEPARPVRAYLGNVLGAAFDCIVHYSLHKGLTFERPSMLTNFKAALKLTDEEAAELPTAPAVVFGMLLKLLAAYGVDKQPRGHARCVVIVDRMDLLLPNGDKAHMADDRLAMIGMLAEAGRDKTLASAGNMMIFLTPSTMEIHSDIRQDSTGIKWTEIQLPDYTRRLRFIQNRCEFKDWNMAVKPEQFAAQTAGLSLVQIEDIGLQAKGNPITGEYVEQHKADIIRNESDGTLQIRKPEGGFDMLGGMAEFKTWAREWVVDPWQSTDPEVRAAIPLTILLSGPPGTGKTTVADALANELGLNCIEYKTVKDSLVGASERNDAKAQNKIRASAPCVLFMDEIDQDIGRVTGGAGGGAESIDKALFRSRLAIMADESLRGSVLIVAGSNRPDQIDDAMMSRFEFRVPILPPESDEARAEILVKLMARYGVTGLKAKDLLKSAGLMEDWSGRDMKQAVVKARGLMRLRKLAPVPALEEAARTRKPLQRADAEAMTKLAIVECNDLDLLPAKYRAQNIKREEVDKQVAEVRERAGRDLAL